MRAPAPSFKQTMRYRFDALLSRGPLGVILLLLVVTLAFVLVASVIFAGFGMHQRDVGEKQLDELKGIRAELARAGLLAGLPGPNAAKAAGK